MTKCKKIKPFEKPQCFFKGLYFFPYKKTSTMWVYKER
nr:MAG TPA: hypothetical protein [Caudoviricetes sp.]